MQVIIPTEILIYTKYRLLTIISKPGKAYKAAPSVIFKKEERLFMAKRLESPSSINTFKQCKRRYYYRYIEKLPTISNIHQVRGNIAHATLEHFFDIDVSSFTPEKLRPLRLVSPL